VFACVRTISKNVEHDVRGVPSENRDGHKTYTHTPEVENHDERIRAKKKVSPKNVELHKLELHMFIIREKMPRHIFRLFRAKYARSDIVQAE
jgi:hypothetical protein